MKAPVEHLLSVCSCAARGDTAVLDMATEFPVFAVHCSAVRWKKTPSWVGALRCERCSQCWLLGSDELLYDVYCLQRIASTAYENPDLWPDVFDRYEMVLQRAFATGRVVRFENPEDSSLGWIMERLAREHPGISVSVLARYLHLETPLATTIANVVMQATGVSIVLNE